MYYLSGRIESAFGSKNEAEFEVGSVVEVWNGSSEQLALKQYLGVYLEGLMMRANRPSKDADQGGQKPLNAPYVTTVAVHGSTGHNLMFA